MSFHTSIIASGRTSNPAASIGFNYSAVPRPIIEQTVGQKILVQDEKPGTADSLLKVFAAERPYTI